MKTSTLTYSHRGFTLIESLAVIGILSLIIALTTPTMLNAIKATRLTSAGELITGKLVEAQGLALTFSSDVELRFYKSPTEKPVDGSSGQFLRLFQLVENNDETDAGEEGEVAKLEPVGSRDVLPDGVSISSQHDFSSLWENLDTLQEVVAEETREYVAIRFRPDGSTNLAENKEWHLTLVDSDHGDSSETPANFYTIQIDPVTAKLEIYRPE